MLILESVQSDDATDLPVKKKVEEKGMFVRSYVCVFIYYSSVATRSGHPADYSGHLSHFLSGSSGFDPDTVIYI